MPRSGFSELVVATGNLGKLRELSDMLGTHGIKVRSQREFDVAEVPETGTTFVENAIIKARNASLHTGLPAIADDSGIEVDALNGAPGVYSARYAGPQCDDDDNNRKLVAALENTPAEERTARFRSVIVLLRHAEDPSPLIAEGTWEGVVQLEPAGANGFGYDPHFHLPERGCTSAQLSSAEKNRLSHRGKALAQLLRHLGDELD